jgi:hypothetical protein
VRPSLLLVPLLLASCATAPMVWTRVDGAAVIPAQLELDQTSCRGEMQRANLSSTKKPLIDEILDPREQPLNQVYDSCMASKGYVYSRP